MEETLIAYGSELKALGEGKVGGYLIRFSTADDPDLTNDFFTKDTDLHFPPEMPVLYNHGLDKTIKKRVIGKAVVNIDEVGAWAEAQLNLRDDYEKEIYKLVEAGKLGYSSGALSHLVEREPAGKAAFIKSWFVGEVSLTPTPAEPRNSVVSLKSLSIPDEAALPIDENETSIHRGENKMEETIDVKALVAAEIKAMKDAEAAEAARKQEIEDARAEGARQAVEELKSKRLLKASEYHTTDKTSDSDEGMSAFKAWLGTGQVNHELIEPDSVFTKTSGVVNLTTAAEGGYLVPDPLYNQIIAKRDLLSWVRQAPCQYFSTVADHLLIPVEDTRHADFTETAESAAYTNETTGNVAQIDLALKKYTKNWKVSEEFLGAQNSNWESYLGNVIARTVAGTENNVSTAIVVADATDGTAFASATAITVAEIARCIGELSNGYAVPSEAGFLVKNATKWYCMGLTGDSFAFLPTPQGPGGFFGFPAYVSDDMAAMTTGLESVVFGNFQYVAVLEKPGVMIQRNPYLYMGSGQIGIFASFFRAFDVLQSEAVRVYKQA
jgi:HK97 family phage major capsid protein